MWTQRCEEKNVAVQGRERAPFGSSFYMFSPPPGPALCKLGWPGALFVLPEVLIPVLRPSFDLPLFYFCWLFPSLSFQFSLVQSLSRVRLFVTPWTAAHQASLSITNSQGLLKLMCIE